MPEPVVASAGASLMGRTNLRGRDLFSVALDDETDSGRPTSSSRGEYVTYSNKRWNAHL
jgi:acetyl-CoA C-acetyltransferase/acetyl-CoA acyltransferase